MKNPITRNHLFFILKCLGLLVVITLTASRSWDMTEGKLNYFLALDRFQPAAIYLAIVLNCWLGLILTPFLWSGPVRLFLVIVLLSGIAIDQFFLSISQSGFNIEMTHVIMENAAMAETAFSGYGRSFLSAAWPFILVSIVFCLPAKHPFSLSGWFGLIPVGTLIAVILVVHLTRGHATQFPPSFAVPAKFYTANLFKLYDGELQKVDYSGEQNPKVRHIVLIMDESVRGDYLGFNNPKFNNTPYLSSHRETFINFGIAVSGGNCSRESRYILRVGVQTHQLPDVDEKTLRQPTIWQYAHKAGYKTILLEAWPLGGKLHSFMNKHEYAQIDESIYLPKTKSRNRDIAMIDTLVELLSSDQPTFILFNKYGAHYPYYHSYPASFTPFDTGPNSTPNVHSRLDHFINSYHNVVQWPVDNFFAVLMKKVSLENAFITYTSDHGQSLLEGGYKQTHCTKDNIHPGEGLVPLLVATENQKLREVFKKAAANSFNQMSHFQIFPTLLDLMGYEKKWIAATFGSDLLSAPPETRRFISGDIFNNFRGNK